MKVKAAIRIPKAASDLESDFSSIGRELRPLDSPRNPNTNGELLFVARARFTKVMFKPKPLCWSCKALRLVRRSAESV